MPGPSQILELQVVSRDEFLKKYWEPYADFDSLSAQKTNPDFEVIIRITSIEVSATGDEVWQIRLLWGPGEFHKSLINIGNSSCVSTIGGNIETQPNISAKGIFSTGDIVQIRFELERFGDESLNAKAVSLVTPCYSRNTPTWSHKDVALWALFHKSIRDFFFRKKNFRGHHSKPR